MIIREIEVKSLLNRSQIYAYCLNPYTGCQIGCGYCYARLFIPRYSLHKEPWGNFVDVKINAVERLKTQVCKAKKGEVWVSSVCDPYQPLERKYKLTRRCLEVLMRADFPVILQTKSDLILRDLDLLSNFKNLEVGMTITTDEAHVARYFEPGAPPPERRAQVLALLKKAGIRTFAFIGPILPSRPKRLVDWLEGKVDLVYLDRLNYPKYFLALYRRTQWVKALDNDFFEVMKQKYGEELEKRKMAAKILF